MHFLIEIQILFALATFVSAAPAKKVKEQPIASSSSGKLVRVNTATCDQETNPKLVLAQHYLPLYQSTNKDTGGWFLHGVWGDKDTAPKTTSKSASKSTSYTEEYVSKYVPSALQKLWRKDYVSEENNKIVMKEEKKVNDADLWYHEVDKHISDFSSLNPACYANPETHSSSQKRDLNDQGNSKSKESFWKRSLEKSVAEISKLLGKGSSSSSSSKTTKSSESATKSIAIESNSAAATALTASSTTAVNEFDVKERRLQDYIEGIEKAAFTKTATGTYTPKYNVYNILKENEIVPGKWYPKKDIVNAFGYPNGPPYSKLICRKLNSDNNNNYLREIDLYLTIKGRISGESQIVPGAISNKGSSNSGECKADCVCYPVVKNGKEVCTERHDSCKDKPDQYPIS